MNAEKQTPKKYCGDSKTIEALFDQAERTLNEMLKDKITKAELVIWGGRFKALTSNLQSFLEAWDSCSSLFTWGLWESASRFDVENRLGQHKIVPPADQLVHVERVRLFGEKGDFDIRRDVEHFHWRFIGDPFNPPTDKPDLSAFAPRDYFEQNGEAGFRKLEKSYYLWRKDEKENRVNTLWIENAELADVDNYLKQVHYFLDGELAFVRYVGIYHAPQQRSTAQP